MFLAPAIGSAGEQRKSKLHFQASRTARFSTSAAASAALAVDHGDPFESCGHRSPMFHRNGPREENVVLQMYVKMQVRFHLPHPL